MRLSQIKLSGFKSFVDSTHIPTPGRIVGIVGPNGCGKSNIIDALRWVLGESKASALRGKSMQDVIFNGSGNRKPVARASVELVFDNSQGRAAGQWSEYAEISVKRILQRDAESSYFINNAKVRRKDVSEIFLGTGLGGHAYAIIEQGMISRIIEADPEELKVFLEEAAGISKYRERRRETELHLKATAENLQRVGDICDELEKRIGYLESQASIAKKYHELQAALKTARNLLSLTLKIQAGDLRRRLAAQAGKLETEMEAETANLRHVESELIRGREEHGEAGERLQALQGELYSANAEVSRFQQQIDHLRSNRSGLENRIESEKRQIAALELQYEEAEKGREKLEQDIAEALRQKEACSTGLDALEKALIEAREAVKAARRNHEEARLAFSKAEHEEKIEQANLGHAGKVLEQLSKRREKLLEAGRPEPDEAALQRLEEELAELEKRIESKRGASIEASRQIESASISMRKASLQVREQEKNLAGMRARLLALQEIQVESDGWLARMGLDSAPRLRSNIAIRAGWENALEAVLRERINAILLEAPCEYPDGEAVLAQSGEFLPLPAENRGLVPLIELVSLKDQAFRGAVGEWLAAVYMAKDMDEALMMRSRLEGGELIVTQQGHVVMKHSIHYYGVDSKLHGVLARQQEIERLSAAASDAASTLDEAKMNLALQEKRVSGLESDLKEKNIALSALEKNRHELQLKRIKLIEANQRALEQSRRIDSELQEIGIQSNFELERLREAEKKVVSARDGIAISSSRLNTARKELEAAESLHEERNRSMQQAAGRSREAEFREKTCALKIEELKNRMGFVERNRELAKHSLAKLQEEIEALDVAVPEKGLQQALADRQKKEEALSVARRGGETLSNRLRELDGKRQQSEMKLGPLRERIKDVLLKEQEARIAEDQHEASLKGATEGELVGLLGESPEKIQGSIAKLIGEIERLGAVNLAAFEELNMAQERKTYLDAQASDLNQAAETLGNAIRRIDHETRERLSLTYEEVNGHFGELFHQLFGGGQARLVLMGEQIIDCGMEIEAQPPGKKNASIRLLSGGEKALTALSLVFALFKLNPAPFCLLDEVDAPLDDSNTERFCDMVRKMAEHTQFIFISHNKITMEMAHQLIGVTMQEQGVSRIVGVDVEAASMHV